MCSCCSGEYDLWGMRFSLNPEAEVVLVLFRGDARTVISMLQVVVAVKRFRPETENWQNDCKPKLLCEVSAADAKHSANSVLKPKPV